VPATLYGAPYLATLEAGMPATFVVADAPLFEKETRILYTFVEGSLERGAEPRARGGAAAGSAPTGGDAPAGDIVQVAGSWSVEVSGPMAQAFTMRLTQEGTTISGSMDGPAGSIPVSGSVDGTRITLTATLTMGGQTIPLSFAGEVRGDEAFGTMDTPMGSMEWRARRTGGTEARP
jgi:hypothetical protein